MTGTENSTPMVRVKFSVPAGSGRREGYWRHVTAVAPDAKNGYGLTGEFVKIGWREFPAGSVLLRVTPCGSARNGWSGADVHIVTPDGLKEYAPRGTYFDMHREFLLLRDALQAALAEPPPQPAAAPVDLDILDALCDERDRIEARLAEIDAERAALAARAEEVAASLDRISAAREAELYAQRMAEMEAGKAAEDAAAVTTEAPTEE